jgi:hypothetical protein
MTGMGWAMCVGQCVGLAGLIDAQSAQQFTTAVGQLMPGAQLHFY